MTGKTFRMHCLRAISWVLAVALGLALTADGRASARSSQIKEPLRFLPKGARLGDPLRDVALADLDGDGRSEGVIFFTREDGFASFAVLAADGADFKTAAVENFPDSPVFKHPSGVIRLNQNQPPKIVAFHSVGPACSGVLDIYEFREGKALAVTGPWADEGQCQFDPEIIDLDQDGNSEIVVKTRKYGVNPDIYKWDGERYVLANRQFADYLGGQLKELLDAIHDPAPLPVSARLQWSLQALEILQRQGRSGDAVLIGSRILEILDDSFLTQPSNVALSNSPEELARVQVSFEIEKASARAKIYRSLARSLSETDRGEEAGRLEEMAAEMEARAQSLTREIRR